MFKNAINVAKSAIPRKAYCIVYFNNFKYFRFVCIFFYMIFRSFWAVKKWTIVTACMQCAFFCAFVNDCIKFHFLVFVFIFTCVRLSAFPGLETFVHCTAALTFFFSWWHSRAYALRLCRSFSQTLFAICPAADPGG